MNLNDQREMNLFNLLSYKLENFINIRPAPCATGPVFYQEDETSLLSVAARKRNGAICYASRWHDLFSVGAFEKAMSKQGYTEADCHALLQVLGRFGLLLEIDNRQRSNKEYFIFFYLIQLISLKNSHCDADAQWRNHMLRFLLFELSMDDETYRRFSIRDQQLLMSTDGHGQVTFLDMIEVAYKAIRADDRKERALLNTLKNYQTGVVKLLTQADDTRYRFSLDDRYSELMYPDVFLHAYTHDRPRVFAALHDTVNPLQSTENLFVSNILLMNYAFYILKDNPRDILALKKYVNDQVVFGKLLEAIIKRRMAVGKASFEKIAIGHDLSLIAEPPGAFYNILYTL